MHAPPLPYRYSPPRKEGSLAIYENPSNGYRREFSQGSVMLCTLVFGFFYFILEGVWKHAVIALFAAVLTFGVSWLVYPLFAYQAIRSHYLERGWKEIEA